MVTGLTAATAGRGRLKLGSFFKFGFAAANASSCREVSALSLRYSVRFLWKDRSALTR